jgi:glycosyltransferase involved in cell wall biosynthesis
MVNEYRNADIVSFCSLAEGFGLPIIEAQALGVPVITSNISPMKEVAGEGALLVDPNNPDCIAAGIAEIINNEALRMKIVGTGSENVRRFSPEHVAGQYWKLYMEIAADNSQHAA